MKITFRQKVLAWCLVAIGIVVSYIGYLIPALLVGTIGIYVATVETDESLFGDEEEETEEEEEL